MFKNNVLQYKINRGQRKDDFDRKAHAYSALKKVGVIFTIEDLKKHEAVKDFIHALESDGIEVKALAYKPKGAQNFEFRFDFFEDKDFGSFGQVRSHRILSFLEHKFDYFFCLDERLNIYMKYLLVNTRLATRIGSVQDNKEDAGLLELMVKPSTLGSTEKLSQDILHYIKKISGND